MHWHRRQGRRWARWLIVALLSMQWVVAVHACGHAAAAAGAAMAGDCPSHGQAQADERALLCKLHCQADAQSVDRSGGEPGGAADAGLAGLAVLAVSAWPQDLRLSQPSDAAPSRHPTGPPVGTPPLYLSLQTLRR